jgi:Zn-dependent peptidase ImmA (M78 family)
MPRQRAEAEAESLRARIAPGEVPVPVDRIADGLGVPIVQESLERNVSGLLLRKEGNRAAIGVNATHAYLRQRFTIAHELGHFLLHPGRELILDHVRVDLRDDVSSMGTDRQEREANAFAAELLMPAVDIRAEVQRLTEAGQTPDSRFVSDLAIGFSVSEQAMEYRLINLGLLRQI